MGSTRQAVASPLGEYAGKVEIVSHEGSYAVRVIGMTATDGSGAAIREFARFVPENLSEFIRGTGAGVGTVADVKLVRMSPRRSVIRDAVIEVRQNGAPEGARTARPARTESGRTYGENIAAGIYGFVSRWDDAIARVGIAVARAAANHTAMWNEVLYSLSVGIGAAVNAWEKETRERRLWVDTLAAAFRAIARAARRNETSFGKIVRKAAARDEKGFPIPIMLVGPVGCGKSTMVEEFAAYIEAEFYGDEFNQLTDPDQLTGRREPKGANREIVYQTPAYVRAYEADETGTARVWCGDEIDAADANNVLALNKSLANHHMNLPERIGAERCERSRRNFIFTTANTYGHGSAFHTERNVLGPAFLDRFTIITVGYDAAYEKATLDAAVRDGLTRSEADALREFCAMLRNVIDGGNLKRVFSTRTMKRWIAHLLAGDTLDELAEDYFAAWSTADLQKVRAGFASPTMAALVPAAR